MLSFCKTIDRTRGFIEAVKDADLYKPDNVQEVSYQMLEKDMDEAIIRLLHSKNRVDAIFFATNTISMAGIKSLLKHEILIQKDIQVMCFDETDAINLFHFKVPFIKQPIEEMAKRSLELLIERIENKNAKIRKQFLEAELIA